MAVSWKRRDGVTWHDFIQVDILEGGGAHDSYGVLVIQSPTNGSLSTNCDTAAAAAATDHGSQVTSATLRQVNARSSVSDLINDDRRLLGRAYRKQLSTWDSIRSKLVFLYTITNAFVLFYLFVFHIYHIRISICVIDGSVVQMYFRSSVNVVLCCAAVVIVVDADANRKLTHDFLLVN